MSYKEASEALSFSKLFQKSSPKEREEAINYLLKRWGERES